MRLSKKQLNKHLAALLNARDVDGNCLRQDSGVELHEFPMKILHDRDFSSTSLGYGRDGLHCRLDSGSA